MVVVMGTDRGRARERENRQSEQTEQTEQRERRGRNKRDGEWEMEDGNRNGNAKGKSGDIIMI